MERASGSNPLDLEGSLEKKGRGAALLLLLLFSPLRGEKRGVVFSGEYLLPLTPQGWAKGGAWESEGRVGSSDPDRERSLSLPLSRGRDYGFRLGLALPLERGEWRVSFKHLSLPRSSQGVLASERGARDQDRRILRALRLWENLFFPPFYDGDPSGFSPYPYALGEENSLNLLELSRRLPLGGKLLSLTLGGVGGSFRTTDSQGFSEWFRYRRGAYYVYERFLHRELRRSVESSFLAGPLVGLGLRGGGRRLTLEGELGQALLIGRVRRGWEFSLEGYERMTSPGGGSTFSERPLEEQRCEPWAKTRGLFLTRGLLRGGVRPIPWCLLKVGVEFDLFSGLPGRKDLTARQWTGREKGDSLFLSQGSTTVLFSALAFGCEVSL